MGKLRNQRGESLVEVLCAMLVIAVGMLMLAGSIVTAARVNDAAQSDRIATTIHGGAGSSAKVDVTQKIGEDTRKETDVEVTVYAQKKEVEGDETKTVLIRYE